MPASTDTANAVSTNTGATVVQSETASASVTLGGASDDLLRAIGQEVKKPNVFQRKWTSMRNARTQPSDRAEMGWQAWIVTLTVYLRDLRPHWKNLWLGGLIGSVFSAKWLERYLLPSPSESEQLLRELKRLIVRVHDLSIKVPQLRAVALNTIGNSGKSWITFALAAVSRKLLGHTAVLDGNPGTDAAQQWSGVWSGYKMPDWAKRISDLIGWGRRTVSAYELNEAMKSGDYDDDELLAAISENHERVPVVGSHEGLNNDNRQAATWINTVFPWVIKRFRRIFIDSGNDLKQPHQIALVRMAGCLIVPANVNRLMSCEQVQPMLDKLTRITGPGMADRAVVVFIGVRVHRNQTIEDVVRLLREMYCPGHTGPVLIVRHDDKIAKLLTVRSDSFSVHVWIDLLRVLAAVFQQQLALENENYQMPKKVAYETRDDWTKEVDILVDFVGEGTVQQLKQFHSTSRG